MALAVQMASIAEASAVGKRLGLDPKVLAEVFNSSSSRCWSSEAYHPVPVSTLWHCVRICLCWCAKKSDIVLLADRS